MGFFTTVVFLPRWYQVVAGASATESGYQILPLLGGLIVSAVTAGQPVARVGRYKTLIFGALLLLAFGLYLLTNIRPDTNDQLVWLWMAVAGLGIGPSFAVFTLVVQNAVPVRQLGSGTSAVTLFQQVGGTVGLSIAGTIFGSVLLDEIPTRMVEARRTGPVRRRLRAAGRRVVDAQRLSGVGDLGAAILADVPEPFHPAVEPLIPAILDGIHTAFSVATGATFVVGIVTALLAALVGLVLMPAGKVGERPDARVPVVEAPSATA